MLGKIKKACKWCGSQAHYQSFCFKRPKKAIKVVAKIKKVGRRENEYRKWRDKVAIPYLDKAFGHKCADCGTTENLAVDHIKNRGSHPELKMKLFNVQWLCPPCHRHKTDRTGRYKGL